MEEQLIKKILPHSAEAEQSVIGAMIMDQEAILTASEILTSDDFYNPQFRTLYDAMLALYQEGKPVDLVTLQNRLQEMNAPAELCSVEFISNIIAAVPTSANVKYYSEIVRQKAVLRRLIRVTEGIANECYQDNEKLEDILEQTEKQVFDVVQNRASSDFDRSTSFYGKNGICVEYCRKCGDQKQHNDCYIQPGNVARTAGKTFDFHEFPCRFAEDPYGTAGRPGMAGSDGKYRNPGRIGFGDR